MQYYYLLDEFGNPVGEPFTSLDGSMPPDFPGGSTVPAETVPGFVNPEEPDTDFDVVLERNKVGIVTLTKQGIEVDAEDATLGASIKLREATNNGLEYVGIKAMDSLPSSSLYTLPASLPAYDKSFLKSDTLGNLRWRHRHRAIQFNSVSITPGTTADFDFFTLTIPANEFEALDVVHFDCYGLQQQTNVLLGENRVIEFYLKANTTKVCTVSTTLDNNTATRGWESYGQILVGSIGTAGTIKFSQVAKVSGFSGTANVNNTVYTFNSTASISFTVGMRYTSTARANNLASISSGFIRME